jgi:hypothetical protein
LIGTVTRDDLMGAIIGGTQAVLVNEVPDLTAL